MDPKRHCVRRARQRIIGQGSREELALFVEDSTFHQRLAYSLHDPGMRLAGYQQRVHDYPKIIDH